ncbi:hypothetical protein KKF84_11985 [Myxococcota bacterium]|nr:hypothetical protein [Myxococcota bacterium]
MIKNTGAGKLSLRCREDTLEIVAHEAPCDNDHQFVAENRLCMFHDDADTALGTSDDDKNPVDPFVLDAAEWPVSPRKY